MTDKNFNLQPDIFMEHKQTHKKIVLDTKWKRYDNNNEISQPDAYQMFAYSEAYDADAILLYPKDHALTEQKKSEIHIFECGEKKILKTHITDLDKSPKEIAENIINAISKLNDS